MVWLLVLTSLFAVVAVFFWLWMLWLLWWQYGGSGCFFVVVSVTFSYRLGKPVLVACAACEQLPFFLSSALGSWSV